MSSTPTSHVERVDAQGQQLQWGDIVTVHGKRKEWAPFERVIGFASHEAITTTNPLIPANRRKFSEVTRVSSPRVGNDVFPKLRKSAKDALGRPVRIGDLVYVRREWALVILPVVSFIGLAHNQAGFMLNLGSAGAYAASSHVLLVEEPGAQDRSIPVEWRLELHPFPNGSHHLSVA